MKILGNGPLSTILGSIEQDGVPRKDLFFRISESWRQWFLVLRLAVSYLMAGGVSLHQVDVPGFAARLGTTDAGTRIQVIDYGHVLVWDGSKLDFDPLDAGSNYFVMAPAAPKSVGYHLCDGSVVQFLQADGNLSPAVTLPNLAATPGYGKLGPAYAAVITPATPPTVVNPGATGEAFTGITVPDDTGSSPTGITVPANTGSAATGITIPADTGAAATGVTVPADTGAAATGVTVPGATGTPSNTTTFTQGAGAAVTVASPTHTHPEGPVTDPTHTHTEGPITDPTHTHTEGPVTDPQHTHTEGPITDPQHSHKQGPVTDPQHSHPINDPEVTLGGGDPIANFSVPLWFRL